MVFGGSIKAGTSFLEPYTFMWWNSAQRQSRNQWDIATDLDQGVPLSILMFQRVRSGAKNWFPWKHFTSCDFMCRIIEFQSVTSLTIPSGSFQTRCDLHKMSLFVNIAGLTWMHLKDYPQHLFWTRNNFAHRGKCWHIALERTGYLISTFVKHVESINAYTQLFLYKHNIWMDYLAE